MRVACGYDLCLSSAYLEVSCALDVDTCGSHVCSSAPRDRSGVSA